MTRIATRAENGITRANSAFTLRPDGNDAMNIHRYPQALRAIFAVSGMRCGKDILQGTNIATSQDSKIGRLRHMRSVRFEGREVYMWQDKNDAGYVGGRE
jgi:hypothetical protein